MKNPIASKFTAAIAMACLFAAPLAAEAKDKGKKYKVKHVPPGHLHVPPGHAKRSSVDERALRAYAAYPRSSYAVTYGNGYAGRGYYYGPSGVPYYYQQPGVAYYRSRDAVPRQYWGQDPYRSRSVEVGVQRALAEMGYYRGGVDGSIGPMTRAAIARYQADHGMVPTGQIDSALMRALRL